MSECIIGKSGTRAWYVRKHGPLSSEIHVLHTCDQPNCRNEDHIFLGSRSDNMKDMVMKGRARGTTGKKFEIDNSTKLAISLANRGRILHSKLSLDQVNYIKNSSFSNVNLAKEFNVGPKTIGRIRNGLTWRNS